MIASLECCGRSLLESFFLCGTSLSKFTGSIVGTSNDHSSFTVNVLGLSLQCVTVFPPIPTVPIQTLVPPLTYDWRNRRSRRRYEECSNDSMRSVRNDIGNNKNRNKETIPLGTELILGSKYNKPSNDKELTTETSQSSREGQKRAQEASEKLPIIYEDKTQNSRILDTSSSDTNGNKGLTEPCNLNTEIKPIKSVSSGNQLKCEKRPIIYEDKAQDIKSFDSSSTETNGNRGPTDPTRKTFDKTASFENQSESDKKKSSAFQHTQKFVEVSEDKEIVDDKQLKCSEKAGPKKKKDVDSFEEATEDAAYTHLSEPIKEAPDVKPTFDSVEDSKKKNNDFQTKAYITKIRENRESIKGLFKKVPENQFQHCMKMANPNTNGRSDLNSVKNSYLEEKATELDKIAHEAVIENISSNESLSCMVKDEKDNQNSARPRSPYPDFMQSVPTEHLNRKRTDSIRSANLACIEEENHNPNSAPRSPYPECLQLNLDRKNCAVGENSIEKKFMASGLEEQKENPNLELDQPRLPYSNSLHIVPEVLNSTNKCFNPISETPVSKTNGASNSNNTNPVDEKPLNSSLRLIPYNPINPEMPNSTTKSLNLRKIEVPLHATNGTSKSDKTNLNEKNPSKSTLRLIPAMIPDSSASETSDTESVVELKKTAITPEKVKPVPTIPSPAKNEKLPKRMSEILSSIPNPFKQRSKSYSPQSKSQITKVETDEEIKHMTELHPQRPTNIYKLAYNESITDSSSTHSRSLSPVDREKLIPRNTFHDEIVVYEADSESEPGSEDVELLPHRYDCDHFQNRENNLYINKLSLAVELIRTQEKLPYDDQFKRIVEDDSDAFRETSGEENFGFEDVARNAGKGATNSLRNVVVTSPPRRSDTLATTGVTSTAVDTFTDSCEETATAGSQLMRSSEETRAINRRFRGHMRHYLSTRTFGNPCLCCILM